MHPLRFPYSDIKAMVFVRKISFKLRVMRLNRIKSFYAFLLRFCRKRSEERGGWPRPKPLVVAVASKRGRSRAWLALVGVGNAHGQARLLAGAAPTQGDVARSLTRATPPARKVPPEGSSTYRKGGCPRRRRAAPSPLPCAGDSSGDVVRVREEG
ncbi:hypothetical protein GW17_00041646 [Ensete ventricosum]|nr:hypothetical protein GW17_00041646 [Ensete ventricosum]